MGKYDNLKTVQESQFQPRKQVYQSLRDDHRIARVPPETQSFQPSVIVAVSILLVMRYIRLTYIDILNLD